MLMFSGKRYCLDNQAAMLSGGTLSGQTNPIPGS